MFERGGAFEDGTEPNPAARGQELEISMNSPEYYGGPDWWGRLMALGALVAALASLYLVNKQSQDILPRDEQLAHLNANLDNWNQRAGEQINELREATQQELTEYRQRFNTLASQLEQANDGLDRMELAQDLPTNTSDPNGNSNADPNNLFTQDPTPIRTEVADLGNPNSSTDPPREDRSEPDRSSNPSGAGEPSQFETGSGDAVANLDLPTGPKLLVVRRAFRTSETQLARAVITNSGDETAVIDEVYFVPLEEVRVADEAAERPAVGGEQVAQIIFGRTDNSSWAKGQQGTYRKELSEPLRLAPGDELEIDIEIQNRDHRGWGLMGELTLVADEDNITLDQTTAIFREAPSE